MTERYPVTIHVAPEMLTKIDQPIDEAVISRRPGGGNTTQAYLKGDIIADQLNEVFGPLGWSKASKIHTIDDWEETKTVTRSNVTRNLEMHMVQVISDVTLTIKKTTPDGSDTVFIEQGVGYGEVEKGKSRKEAFGMAVKGASTDGLKRCSSLLGKRFGMMMASSGSQIDIEYAHNGKSVDMNKARAMRAQKNGGDANTSRTNDRSNQRDDRSNQRNDARDQRRDAPARDNSRSNEQNRDLPQRETSSREQERRPAQERNGRDAEPKRDDTQKTAASDRQSNNTQAQDGKPKPARRAPNTNYALESVPVTLEDQTDFGATLATRVKEMRQKADREGLVKQHINTIRNLDAPIRKRLRERLQEEGVDVDKIAS